MPEASAAADCLKPNRSQGSPYYIAYSLLVYVEEDYRDKNPIGPKITKQV